MKLKIYKSFEELEEAERAYSASLTPIERLMHLRKSTNLAYGMHGYDPENLPKKHSIKNIRNIVWI